MTRKEAEQKIKEKLYDIVKIYKEYEPNGTSLHMAFVNESVICFNIIGQEQNQLTLWKK